MKNTLMTRFIAFLIFGFSTFQANVFAQCPIANTCSPAPGAAPSGNWIFGMGIFNVNVNNGAINNTTLGASQGYQNYSCTIGATVLSSVAIPISIQTNANANENVRVWIDYNNDGTLHATNELAFSSLNAKLHTGTFTIPASAVTNTPLRMRVSADNFSSPLPTPCSTPQYSQVEDYRITVTSNTNPPTPDFSANNTTTCNATVSFTDLSQNGPTSWLWNFGDTGSGANNTSTLQNPSHTFSATGQYTVTLTATNANGSNSITKTNYITYHTNVPVAASCSPATLNYCCGYGITNVNFGSGLMTNTSANGSAGYQDFTCTKSVSVIAGNTYPFSLTSGTNPQDTRIYIDLNNNGSFADPNEMIVQVLNQVNPSGNITIPGTTFLNTPLRMRIISDEIGSTFNSCNGIQSGQAEDYTILISPNPNPPVAQFTSNYTTSCDTTIQFTDQSTNAPTSWLWNFGDPASGTNNTSTLKNPVHIYHNPGNYTVTLTATNSNGSNSITKTNYITVIKPCLIYCPSTGHTNNNIHISNVTLSNLNNTTGQASGGYSDFTNMAATLLQGNPATLSVSRGGLAFNSSVSAWIDFNRNGTFEISERVMAQNGSNTTATASVIVPASAPLGTTRMRVMTSTLSTAPTNPCLSNQFNMEVEDYSIIIQTNQQPPLPDFTVPSQITCSGNVQFTDNSINIPTSWSWNFGDPASGMNNTSTLKNPSHTYATTGLYTVRLIACNSFGCDTIVKTNFINYDPTNAFCTTVIMPANGTAPDATLCSGTVYDPGGPGSNYPNAADSKLTIAPANAATVSLTFSSFDLENNFDFLRIYDGPNVSSPLIGIYSGTTLPNGGTITSTSSALTLHFTSDNVANRAGYAAVWNCTPVSTKPVANLRADLNTICTGNVPFQDLSTNSPTSWLWDFGNGTTSTLKNPTATYSTTTPGSYPVTLIACNSFGCDTIVQQNYINITVPCLTYCVSNGHNNSASWIQNIVTAGISNATGPENNGYGNYTNITGNMMLGSTNPISVTTGSSGAAILPYIAIWIDFNKDGLFQPAEKIFNARTNTSGPNAAIASGNINIPSTAMTGTTRMRVIMSQFATLADPCITNQTRMEVEDYTINIQPNTLPVVSNFTANLNSVCTGTVQFIDASLNGATSWLWDFGNGTTSTFQNPTASFSTTTPGSYNVTLIACKNGVCDTITKNNYVNITVPCVTYCPSENHTNTNQWISNVTFGSINNTTGPDANGYGNYTYLSRNLVTGTANNAVSVTLGSSSGGLRYVAIFIDFNRDGNFQTTERVYNNLTTNIAGVISTTGNIAIPSSALTSFTRMRVIMSTSSAINPCISNIFNAETEDYLVNIQPNNLPVVANFTANLNNVCFGTVPFTDISQNGATSWLWNFGNGTTSTLQNPTASYSTTSPGSYNVTLIACKNGVCDTITKNNYVTITVPCLNYCPSNGHTNINQWIGNVTFGTINNTTVAEPNAYGNYTYLSRNLITGSTSNPITIALGNTSGSGGYVHIWIDFNRDGIFQTTEKVVNTNFTGLTVSGNIIVPSNASIGVTRMRIIYTQIFGLNDPCATNLWSGETEDYAINILPNTIPPITEFTADQTITCNGQVSFTDLSQNNPTSWLWNFGDGNTSTLQNPTHTYATQGTYNVTLTATNTYGSNPLTKTAYITYNATHPVCFTVNMPTNGSTVTRTTCTGTIYDDGGPNGNYSDLANGTVVISPPGATRVSLTFTSFELESCCDYVTIYDGPNTSSPLLGTFNGINLPNGGAPFNSTGGSLTVKFTSDQSVNMNGFAANWTCQQNIGIPNPDFTPVAFEVYPNPSAGQVNVKLNGNNQEDFDLEVTDVLGKVLLQNKATLSGKQAHTLDMRHLAKGVYFIKIRNSKTSGMKRIVLE